MIRTHEVQINRLMGDDSEEINLNRNYANLKILCIIMPSKDQKAPSHSIRRTRMQSSEVHFKWIYQCQIFSQLNPQDQCQLMHLMDSRNFNNHSFDRNLEHRDDGTITVGTFLRIMSPQRIENRTNGDIPLVNTHFPLIVMHLLALCPTANMINDTQPNHSLAFVFSNIHLNANQTFVVQTTCTRNHCDKKGSVIGMATKDADVLQ